MLSNLELRHLSTGDAVVFDRDARTLHIIRSGESVDETPSREQLQSMVNAGKAVAIDRRTLDALYQEFTRIALLQV